MSDSVPPKSPSVTKLAALRATEAEQSPSSRPPSLVPGADELPANGEAAAMSELQKQSIAFQALGLMNEQVEARIVHYKAEMKTSPELDAITAQVVAQIKKLQAAAAAHAEARVRKTSGELEVEQISTLTQLLGRVFSKQSGFATQIIKPLGRKIAKLFFESELHQKTKGDKAKVIDDSEQGVYYVLQRYSNRPRAELEGFTYANDETKISTFATLAKVERDLQVAFLSRRSPELNRVMTIFTGVLTEFLQTHLPPRIEQMAKLTIRRAETAKRPNSVGYRVGDDAFPLFRHEWERVFMDQMVHFCGDELLAQLQKSDAAVREETVKFFTDPHVFSETVEVLCDHLYDFLCLEGFLELPLDWRVQLARN